jgi:hypothetical protein
MRVMRNCILAWLLLGLSTAAASAIDANGHYTIRGPGAVSCGTWLSDVRISPGPELSGDVAWITGYLTAYNHEVSGPEDIAGGTDMAGIEAWISNYCSANPLKRLDDAVRELIIYLERQNPIAAPAAVPEK